MKYLIKHSVLAALLLLQVSCKKNANAPTNNNNVTGPNYDQYGTPFTNMPAVDDVVMYEVNLRAFSTTGNLQGVINRLDSIQSLGVNVVWLMPIHPIGQLNSINSPYCVKDYKAVSTEYGTLDDLRSLTTLAHSKGIAVIMDWVANHTSWDNTWISNKSWYTQDASGNIVSPPGTGWTDVADLNYSNTDMRHAMLDAMEYWLMTANVDGFRCDYADGIPYDFWGQTITSIRSIPNRKFLFLAEGTRLDHFTAGFDVMYGWNFYSTMQSTYQGGLASFLYVANTNEYTNVPGGKLRLRYTTNHDESAWNSTPMVLFNGKAGALAASVATIFMDGVPLFYTGQEVGRVSNVPFFSNSPINWSDNPDMLGAYKQIMAVYTTSATARKGTNTDYSSADVVCFEKSRDSTEVLIVVNVRNNSIAYTVPTGLQNTNWLNALTNNTMILGTSLQLTNYQYLILKKL